MRTSSLPWRGLCLLKMTCTRVCHVKMWLSKAMCDVRCHLLIILLLGLKLSLQEMEPSNVPLASCMPWNNMLDMIWTVPLLLCKFDWNHQCPSVTLKKLRKFTKSADTVGEIFGTKSGVNNKLTFLLEPCVAHEPVVGYHVSVSRWVLRLMGMAETIQWSISRGAVACGL